MTILCYLKVQQKVQYLLFFEKTVKFEIKRAILKMVKNKG